MTQRSKIDFMDVYAVEYEAEDKGEGTFQAELTDGSFVSLKLEVSIMPWGKLPCVYNLAFGPMDYKGRIDVHARLNYRKLMKVFSTILLFVDEYLRAYPGHNIGVDGSSNSRAEFYYRGWQRNFVYLSAYMKLTGIKFYVRIARVGHMQYDNPFDFKDIRCKAFPVSQSGPPAGKIMYNYFVISRDGYGLDNFKNHNYEDKE
ncbi:DUF6934 family protein [Chitinophaga barathri]|uniref:Uncharacterized protein n=1 Tax=Chitinophaga barathri TaxID=1647451 RepID=A0A3N4MJ51_9BACT|nr:hypothetical protein [Chitinophaga barathri]RPD42086.1 hypothetical protein EG028_08025 [Chitinophaga barathri]